MVDYAEIETQPSREAIRFSKLPRALKLLDKQEDNFVATACMVVSEDMSRMVMINKPKYTGSNSYYKAFVGGSKQGNESSRESAVRTCFEDIDLQENEIKTMYPFLCVKRSDDPLQYVIYYCIVTNGTPAVEAPASKDIKPTWYSPFAIGKFGDELFMPHVTKQILKGTGVFFPKSSKPQEGNPANVV